MTLPGKLISQLFHRFQTLVLCAVLTSQMCDAYWFLFSFLPLMLLEETSFELSIIYQKKEKREKKNWKRRYMALAKEENWIFQPKFSDFSKSRHEFVMNSNKSFIEVVELTLILDPQALCQSWFIEVTVIFSIGTPKIFWELQCLRNYMHTHIDILNSLHLFPAR